PGPIAARAFTPSGRPRRSAAASLGAGATAARRAASTSPARPRWRPRLRTSSPVVRRPPAAAPRSAVLRPRSTTSVRAAGGLVCRVTPRGAIEVLVVHRPRYDDWTLPKGKVDPGESDEEAALREVREETGYYCAITALLAVTTHESGQGTNAVAWYGMRPVPEGSGTLPDDEIDEVRWLSPEEAMALVDYENGRRLIEQAPFERLLRGRGPS